MEQPFYRKIDELKDIFSQISSKKEIYKKILELGSMLPSSDSLSFTEEDRVDGCQSIVYIKGDLRDGLLHFSAASDALISSGLAYILIFAYSGSDPKTILLKPPAFLNDLQIPHSLSMSRSNGLFQMYKHIQKITLQEVSKKN